MAPLRLHSEPQKFVARKARKFKQQGGRLALPALEFAYLFLGIAHAPRRVVHTRMLPLVDQLLAELENHARDPGGYGAGTDSHDCGSGADEFWDDRCLAHFLRGICLRYVAYPDPDALLDTGEEEEVRASRAESARGAREAFEAVFRDGPKVVYDHYLVYYARESPRSLFPCLSHPRLRLLLRERGSVVRVRASAVLTMGGGRPASRDARRLRVRAAAGVHGRQGRGADAPGDGAFR